MQRRQLGNLELSTPLLGFGTMRLPLQEDKKTVDFERVQQMVDCAMENGVNYFDTAYPYHDGTSEENVGRALAKDPRDSYILVDKLPIWACKEKEDMQKVFDTQLERCGVDYFDIYLLHAVSHENYDDAERLGAYDFMRRMQAEGKVRHVGFSFHDSPAFLQRVLASHRWDVAQMQLNYVDWSLQHADEQYRLFTEAGVPLIVMEPVRGGFLAKLPESAQAPLRACQPDWSDAAWALRWVAGHPNVRVILSGMSDLAMMEENIDTLKDAAPLTEEEERALAESLEELSKVTAVPCTGCRYCMPCPFGVDIPRIFALYNDYKRHQNQFLVKSMYQRFTPAENRADQCRRCGACMKHCPQHIEIPDRLAEIHAEIQGLE